MITVEEALNIVSTKTFPTNQTEERMLSESLRCNLAENVLSPINMPPFAQSAMDGYAVNCVNKNAPFYLIGEVAAGQEQNFVLDENQAVRIFTGAEVPGSANMVVRQEDVVKQENSISINAFPNVMSNIRPLGEQIMKEDIALCKGDSLNAASIGFLTSIGVEKVTVFTQPKIAIIATGSELISAGKILKPGQIYDSNSIMLKTALQANANLNPTIFKIEDDYTETVQTVAHCLENFDLLICSGGISVGDYDFIGKSLNENNVTTHFYKVKQKPGKPLYFGQKGNCYVFGLPGNPAACLTTFYIYILPFLSKVQGGKFKGLPYLDAKLSKKYTRKGDRAEFLKAKVEVNSVEILEGQSSAMLQSFAMANAIIYLPLHCLNIAEGETVKYFLLK